MSLSKAKTRVKEGVKELQTVAGLKRAGLHFGIGVALGAIVALILQYVFSQYLNPWMRSTNPEKLEWHIKGIAIWKGANIHGEPVLYISDIILIVMTVAMLFTKKLWLVVGFFVGWYSSGALGLYWALGGPPEPPVE